MEVDYTEKLNFSDDEENQAAKEKRENWWVFLIFNLFPFTICASLLKNHPKYFLYFAIAVQ